MKRLSTDIKIGIFSMVITFLAACLMIYSWYQDHTLSRLYIGEAQRISKSLAVVPVSEGRVAQLTDEMRKNESYKGELDAHLVEQINKIRLGQYTADQLSDHIASCKKFCALLLGDIFESNVREIASLPHEVIFFRGEEDRMSPKDRQRLQEFARKYGNQSVYLVGRARFSGGAGYNKTLSERRVKQIEAFLRKEGFSDFQLKATWLGYEAPPLTKEIADSYGISPEEYQANELNLNQSVVLFVNSPGQIYPGVMDAMARELEKRQPRPSNPTTAIAASKAKSASSTKNKP